MRISDWSSDVCSSDLGVSISIRIKRNFRAELDSFGLTGECQHLRHDIVRGNAAGEPAGDLLDWPSDVKAWFGAAVARSEERRVGKEGVSTCRARWWPYH